MHDTLGTPGGLDQRPTEHFPDHTEDLSGLRSMSQSLMNTNLMALKQTQTTHNKWTRLNSSKSLLQEEREALI